MYIPVRKIPCLKQIPGRTVVYTYVEGIRLLMLQQNMNLWYNSIKVNVEEEQAALLLLLLLQTLL